MPHLVILYTGQLDRELDMPALCRTLCNTMLETRDESGKPVFPTGGTRVLAYPAPHYAIADGTRDYGFVYLNLRMAKGRSTAVHKTLGEALVATVQREIAPVFANRHIGVTLQIDEGHEVFDGRHSNIHPLFSKP